jgi:GNAT superfamily N-acetyltransferase
MESESGEPVFIDHDTPRPMSINPLDNPVWHALTGPHRVHALGRGAARHYPRDMAPFSAISEPSERAYAELATDLPPRTEARLFRPQVEPVPSGWEELDSFPMLQMAAARAPDVGGEEVSPLSEADIPAMLEFASIAKPGPFGRRTPTLGRYLGIRRGDRLLAMAGERMLLQGHVELSAICVHPQVRGQGLGAAVTAELVRQALARDELAFLHVRPENTKAVSLYGKLGFVTRREVVVTWRRPR